MIKLYSEGMLSMEKLSKTNNSRYESSLIAMCELIISLPQDQQQQSINNLRRIREAVTVAGNVRSNATLSLWYGKFWQ